MSTQLCAYLSYDGNCAEAMKFYAQVLGAKLEALITYGEMPGGDPVPQNVTRPGSDGTSGAQGPVGTAVPAIDGPPARIHRDPSHLAAERAAAAADPRGFRQSVRPPGRVLRRPSVLPGNPPDC